MASPTFGLLPGNNAPLPPSGFGNNPTGRGGGLNNSFPNFPLFGMPSGGPVSPLANAPLFSGTSMQGLSTGLVGPLTASGQGDKFYKELSNAFGPGATAALWPYLMGGTFNPQVASAFLNAMQPGVNRGEASLLNAFGAEGSRFGSAASLGLGDYLSQVNLNEQQTLAQMYMQSQQQEMSLLTGLLPTLHAEQANKGGFWHDILGGLETAAGVALEFVPGGQVAGTALIGGGIGTLAGGLDHSGQGGGSIPSFGMPMSMSTPPFFGNNSGITSDQQSNIDFWNMYDMTNLQSSAGDALNHLAG